MRKLILFWGLLLCPAAHQAAFAQTDVPRVEVFGRFSYLPAGGGDLTGEILDTLLRASSPADYLNLNADVKVGPGAVGGHGRKASGSGQRETGAVSQGQAFWLQCWDKGCCQRRLIGIEKNNFDRCFTNSFHDLDRIVTVAGKPAEHFAEVDGGEAATLRYLRHKFRTGLTKKESEERGSIKYDHSRFASFRRFAIRESTTRRGLLLP